MNSANIKDTAVLEMPWLPLMQAFVANIDYRKKMMDITLSARHPNFEMREFRTLTVGGPRQSGKTTAGREIVLANSNARLINANHFNPEEESQVIHGRTIKYIDENSIRDVEILVINQDGYPITRDNPYGTILDLYTHNPELFHPNFSVIYIL